MLFFFFFFNDTATTEIYTLSLHDALPISTWGERERFIVQRLDGKTSAELIAALWTDGHARSEEHTSELQSQSNLVCRLLLEKKKEHQTKTEAHTHYPNAMTHHNAPQLGYA